MICEMRASGALRGFWRQGKVIRGYRTLSAEVACGLAGTSPWNLEAEMLAEAHRRVAEFRMN